MDPSAAAIASRRIVFPPGLVLVLMISAIIGPPIRPYPDGLGGLFAIVRFGCEAGTPRPPVVYRWGANDPRPDMSGAFAAMHGPDLLYLARYLWPWGMPHEAARVHRTPRRRGGSVADRDKDARPNCPADRLSQQCLARPVRATNGCIPSGPTRRRLCRRPERQDRVPLGGG